MDEKIIIGIAVFAFLVLSVISPPHITIFGAVIIAALACAHTIREKRYLGEIKQLQKANAISMLNLCEDVSSVSQESVKYLITRGLIDFIVKEKDPSDFYLRCAKAIIKMGTTSMVAGKLSSALELWQRENLERLKRKIEDFTGKAIEK